MSLRKGVLCECELFELCKPMLPPQRDCLRWCQQRAMQRKERCHVSTGTQMHLKLNSWVKGAINYRLCLCQFELSFHHLHWVLNNVIFTYLLLLCFCLWKRTLSRWPCHLRSDPSPSIYPVLSVSMHCLFILITPILSLLWFHTLSL